MPASLHGHSSADRTAGRNPPGRRRSLASHDVERFTAVVFGAGDYRTPTEHRPEPPRLHRGDGLALGPLRATVIAVLGHPRLVEVQFERSAEEIWEGIARHGRPIQYAYVPEPLAIWDTWTSIASRPVAFEAPSAGFVLDWAMLARHPRARRAVRDDHPRGRDLVDGRRRTRRAAALRRAVFDPAGDGGTHSTDDASGRTDRGRRAPPLCARSSTPLVITVGLRPGEGVATQRITPESELRVVDAIVSGLHECGSSHYELLRAFQSDRALETMTRQAEAGEYRAHEFGDAVFISRAAGICEMRATA